MANEDLLFWAYTVLCELKVFLSLANISRFPPPKVYIYSISALGFGMSLQYWMQLTYH